MSSDDWWALAGIVFACIALVATLSRGQRR
jgi:hypothetical protein